MAATAKRPLALAVAIVLFWLAAPAAASAATRYATPSPASGADCSEGSPCSLSTALTGALRGDTVVVNAGSYGSSSAPLGPLSDGGLDLTIEGAVTGAGRPVIYVDAPSPGTPSGAFILSGDGSTIQDLDIEATALDQGLDLTGNDETANRMRVIRAAGGLGDACEVAPYVSNATILESVCVNHNASFGSGAGVQGFASGTLRNDTFVGADYGLYVQGTATVVNSILHGPVGGDLYNDQATVSLTDCEFSSLAESAPTSSTGQVSAPPVFVDSATDNYHTTATSPGVGKGEDSSDNGPLDLDGDLREIAGLTDIGAYEVSQATSVTTGTASAITTSQATVSGSIDPDDAAVQYHFEYGTGTTTSYGLSTTPASLPEQTATEDVSANLTGLAPGTTYHYRLVAEIDGTEYDGADRGFTTVAAPQHNTTPPPALPPAPLLTGLKLSPHSFYASKHGPTLGHDGDTGTRISYRDSRQTTTTFRVYRCVTQRRGRCTKRVLIGSFTHQDHAGRNQLHFTGWLRGDPLAPGGYVLTLTSTAQGPHTGQVATRSTTFEIERPRLPCSMNCGAPLTG